MRDKTLVRKCQSLEKNVLNQKFLSHQVMIKAMDRLDKNTDAVTNQEPANEDDIFGSMIACSLKKIPDGFSKEKLKISLLQTVFEARFSGHYSTNGRGESTSNTSQLSPAVSTDSTVYLQSSSQTFPPQLSIPNAMQLQSANFSPEINYQPYSFQRT